MARLKNKTTARYFEKGKYVKDGLYCWTKSGTDFECKVECLYNGCKAECDCHTAVSKDALEYINELEAILADVVPKCDEGAECPTCHGTGRIGTTDWLTKNISKEQLAKEKAEAIAEHELHIKQDYAREIFEEIENALFNNHCLDEWSDYPTPHYYEELKDDIAELKKKYTVGE